MSRRDKSHSGWYPCSRRSSSSADGAPIGSPQDALGAPLARLRLRRAFDNDRWHRPHTVRTERQVPLPLWGCYPPHRWREVAPRRQPVPEPVEVAGKSSLELRNRLSIHSSRSPVGLHLLEGLPDFPLRDVERLCLGHAAPPVTGWPPTSAGYRSPFGPVPLQNLHPYYGLLRPCAPHRYSGSCGGLPLELLPWHRGDRFPRSTKEPDPGSRRLQAGCRSGRASGLRPNSSQGPLPSPWFRHRPVNFGTSSAVRLRSSLRISPDGI